MPSESRPPKVVFGPESWRVSLKTREAACPPSTPQPCVLWPLQSPASRGLGTSRYQGTRQKPALTDEALYLPIRGAFRVDRPNPSPASPGPAPKGRGPKDGQSNRGLCSCGEEWPFREWLPTLGTLQSHLGNKNTHASLPIPLNQGPEGQGGYFSLAS